MNSHSKETQWKSVVSSLSSNYMLKTSQKSLRILATEEMHELIRPSTRPNLSTELEQENYASLINKCLIKDN